MTDIKVEGAWKDFGYNDKRNGWYGEVISEDSAIAKGTTVRVIHQSDLPVKTTGAGPLGLEYDGVTLTVEEAEGSSEADSERTFRKK